MAAEPCQKFATTTKNTNNDNDPSVTFDFTTGTNIFTIAGYFSRVSQHHGQSFPDSLRSIPTTSSQSSSGGHLLDFTDEQLDTSDLPLGQRFPHLRGNSLLASGSTSRCPTPPGFIKVRCNYCCNNCGSSSHSNSNIFFEACPRLHDMGILGYGPKPSRDDQEGAMDWTSFAHSSWNFCNHNNINNHYLDDAADCTHYTSRTTTTGATCQFTSRFSSPSSAATTTAGTSSLTASRPCFQSKNQEFARQPRRTWNPTSSCTHWAETSHRDLHQQFSPRNSLASRRLPLDKQLRLAKNDLQIICGKNYECHAQFFENVILSWRLWGGKILQKLQKIILTIVFAIVSSQGIVRKWTSKNWGSNNSANHSKL